jgi:hypothetical protein
MKQNEIIALARQAGLHVATDVNWMPIIGLEYAEKLIALARADEREAFKQIIQQTPFSNWFQADVIEAIDKRGQA